MKSKILVLMIIIVLISCKNKDELGLTNPTKKWVYYNSDKKYNKDSIGFISYLKFYDNETCVNFFFNGNQYNTYMDWEFSKSDSILKISDNKFLIAKIYNDSILMKDLKYNRKVKFLNWNILDK